MATASTKPSTSNKTGLPAKQVYVLTAICLCVGLVIGYFFLGTIGRSKASRNPSVGNNLQAPAMAGGHPKLTLEQMKQMADVQASTLLEKSKSDPKNAALLIQIAGIYQASHQFKDAADYFRKALEIDPKNVPARTQLASCLYYSNDVDGALAELDQALKYNPKDVNALFNLGMIKYQGKNDPAGAIAVWQRLLRTNPNLDRKPIVEDMIAEARGSTNTKN